MFKRTNLIALDASKILVADDGGLDVSVSSQGTVQLDSTPTDPTTASTVLVAMWPLDLVASSWSDSLIGRAPSAPRCGISPRQPTSVLRPLLERIQALEVRVRELEATAAARGEKVIS
jgi:hypothetical protein